MSIFIRNTTSNEYISSDQFDETTFRQAAHEDKLGILTGLLFLITDPRVNANSSSGFFANKELLNPDPLWKSFLGRWYGQQIKHIPYTWGTNISDEVVYCLLLDPIIRKAWKARVPPPRKDLAELIELGATKDEDLILLNGKYKDLPALQHLYNMRLDCWFTGRGSLIK
jgi:hypothetical protein